MADAVNPERPSQAYCLDCRKAVGFTGQPIAYSSILRVGWLCPRHNEAEARQIKKEASAGDGG